MKDGSEPVPCHAWRTHPSVQGKQGVQGARGRVRGGSCTANLVEPSRTTAAQR